MTQEVLDELSIVALSPSAAGARAYATHLQEARDPMNDFLAQVEHQAYRMAQYALWDHELALDVVQDSSPIIGATPVPGLYINCGWGTGGFKAIPVGGWTLAHVLATGRNHELAEPFPLSRFHTGRLIDEAAAAGIAH